MPHSFPTRRSSVLLVATCLADLAERRGRKPLASFSFRAQQPLFDGSLFTACGATKGYGVELWATNAAGRVTMTAQAAFAQDGCAEGRVEETGAAALRPSAAHASATSARGANAPVPPRQDATIGRAT